MRACLSFLTVLTVLGITAPVNSLRGGEKTILVEKLPKAVLEAVKKRFPNVELLEAAKETEEGKTEYEVTVKQGRKKIDVMVTPKGTITAFEKEIAHKDLPPKVRHALAKKYPKATYKVVEEVTKVKEGKETLNFYEAQLVTSDKKKIEVKVGANGKIDADDDEEEEEKEVELPRK